MDDSFRSPVSDDEAIVKTIIALGHNLGLEIVAEGMETAAHRAFLIANGCDIAQGYLSIDRWRPTMSRLAGLGG